MMDIITLEWAEFNNDLYNIDPTAKQPWEDEAERELDFN